MTEFKTREVPEHFKEIAQYVYFGEDGYLYWNDNMKETKRKLNQRLGFRTTSQYPQISWKGKSVYIHLLSFWLHHGYLPELIDHINRDIFDYRVDNLRASTRGANRVNSKDNSMNIRTHFLANGSTVYEVSIFYNKHYCYFGRYKDEAIANYVAWQVREWFYPGICPMPDILKRIKETGSRDEKL